MTTRRARFGAALAVAVAASVIAVPAAEASGNQLYVDTAGDSASVSCDTSDPCLTIQQAVNLASSGDTINVAAGTYDGSVQDNGKSLDIIGAVGPSTIITSTSGATAVITSGTTLLQNLDISNAQYSVEEDGGSLTIDHSLLTPHYYGIEIFGGSAAISDTTVSGGSYGLYNNGGGHVGVENTQFSNMSGTAVEQRSGSMTFDSSSVANANYGFVMAGGSEQVTNSAFANFTYDGIEVDAANEIATIDTSTIAGAQSYGGVEVDGGTLIAQHSTFTGNQLAGVDVNTGSVTLTADTLVDNGNAAYLQGSNDGGASSTIVDSTLAGSRAALSLSAGSVTIGGSILSGASKSTCTGPVLPVDGGYNLAYDSSCTLNQPTSTSGAALYLGHLAGNGGGNQTVQIGVNSDALDAIPLGAQLAGGSGIGLCASGQVDGRGVTRPVGAGCDAGALELANPGMRVTATPRPAAPGSTVTINVAVTPGGYGTAIPAPTGTVSVASDGSTIAGCGQLALSSGSATCSTSGLGVGSHVITARYSPKNAYLAQDAGTRALVGTVPAFAGASGASMRIGTTSIVTVSATGNPAPAITEQGVLPRGVIFTKGTGSGQFSGTPRTGTAGTYPVTLTATNPAGAVTESYLLTVVKALSSTALTITPSAPTHTTPTTLQASVTGTAGTATGTVTFLSGSATLCGGPVTLSGGSVSCTATLPAGTRTLTARYSGDDTYAGSSASKSVTVS